jgi:tetratricopeptide (TPR) repeat protein
MAAGMYSMRISLTSPVRKVAFLGGAVCVGLIFLLLSIQQFAGWRLQSTPTLAHLELGSRIDPLDAYYDRKIGEHYLQDNKPVQAAPYFEKALRRDPYSAQLWLELAAASEVGGDYQEQRAAIREALARAPRDVVVQWKAASLFFFSGDLSSGYPLMGSVANNPAFRVQAIRSIFNVSGGDVATTLGVLPATAEVRLGFLNWLLDQQKFQEADQVWPSLIRAPGSFPVDKTFRYFDSLIERHEAVKAASAWNVLCGSRVELRKQQSPGNLILNGGFENPFLSGGFGWRVRRVSGVTAGEQSSVIHGENQALEFEIDAPTLQDSGIYQMVPVEPNSRYELAAFIRTEELNSANGIRLMVTDYYSGAILMSTEEVLGSTGWREYSSVFSTAADTELVKINVGRTPDAGIIRGRVWLDDVRLETK